MALFPGVSPGCPALGNSLYQRLWILRTHLTTLPKARGHTKLLIQKEKATEHHSGWGTPVKAGLGSSLGPASPSVSNTTSCDILTPCPGTDHFTFCTVRMGAITHPTSAQDTHSLPAGPTGSRSPPCPPPCPHPPPAAAGHQLHSPPLTTKLLENSAQFVLWFLTCLPTSV